MRDHRGLAANRGRRDGDTGMELLFWVSIGFVVYVYAGYPLLLAIWAAVAARPVRRRDATREENSYPAVSVVLAAHNEAARLPARMANLLGQDYPGPLEVIVVSDGSTDDPRAALSHLADRIRLIERPRGGKAAALNAAVSTARGEILVFADARQHFAADAVRQLVGSFDDPEVGGATGELVLDCEREPAPDSTVGEGVGLYWRYEKWLRRHESRIRSTLGATGAIYALRRSLWQPLPPSTLLDDVLAPMRVVMAGKRIVFEERARAFDRVAPNGAAEARRKRRTLAGNYQVLALEPRLLVPFVNPVWLQYMSHKVGRLLVPWALIMALGASAWLAREHWIYALALIVQLGFYGLAAFGGWMDARQRGDARRADELSVVPE